ncbi:MAG: hypothetical protein DWI57_13370 [Chloroflexi bacterium]|nr:MAG: hypothetical protein DWI57_13370 [Chloroflexota bacterium]
MNREEMKKELMAQAEASIDRLLEWERGHARPTLSAIETIVLEVGKELEKKMAYAVIERQEEARPVPGPTCSECGKEMRKKDSQPRQVMTLVGELRIERSYYHCARCKTRIFPPGQATGGVGQALVGGDSQTSGLVERDDEQL